MVYSINISYCVLCLEDHFLTFFCKGRLIEIIQTMASKQNKILRRMNTLNFIIQFHFTGQVGIIELCLHSKHGMLLCNMPFTGVWMHTPQKNIKFRNSLRCNFQHSGTYLSNLILARHQC